jgi:hypothetical protein
MIVLLYIYFLLTINRINSPATDTNDKIRLTTPKTTVGAWGKYEKKTR